MCEEQKQKSKTLHVLLEYHHKAMEARRSLGFKAFLSLIAFDLLTLNGAYEIRTSVLDINTVKIMICLVYAILCAIFVLFMIQIEKASRFNRQKYIKLESKLWELAEMGNEPVPPKESLWKTIARSWAATWAILTIILLAIGCCLPVWQIDP